MNFENVFRVSRENERNVIRRSVFYLITGLLEFTPPCFALLFNKYLGVCKCFMVCLYIGAKTLK